MLIRLALGTLWYALGSLETEVPVARAGGTGRGFERIAAPSIFSWIS